MQKPWFIDVLTYVLVAVWMGWTFATMQEYGPSPALIGSAVIMLVAALLLVYNQRVAYLRIGDWLVLGTRDMADRDESEIEDWQRENR